MNILNRFKIREIIIFLGIISLFYLSPYLQYIPIKVLNIDINHITNSQNVLLNLFSNICLFLMFFIFYFKSLKKDFCTFKNDLLFNLNSALKYWIIGFVLMFISNLFIFLINGSIAGNEQTVRSMIKALPFIMLINAGIIAPFNEEIMFRKSLGDIFNSKWLFVICSFLLFGGAHVIGNINNILDILYIIPYGFLGGTFALAYRNTNTIFTPITMHMFHNTMMIITLIFLA